MRRMTESGEGRMGTIVGFVVLGAAALAAWNVIPVYYGNYSFQDRVVELARAPRYSHNDSRIMDLLVRYAEESKIEEYINNRTCSIKTMETRRIIVCEYDRPVKILPGWTHNFHFRNEADQPLL
jgi:hypothetical protein